MAITYVYFMDDICLIQAEEFKLKYGSLFAVNAPTAYVT